MEKFPEENLKEEIYFPDYIKRYGKEVGLPNLKFNENGVCSLCFNNKIKVDIVYNEQYNQCFLASPICLIPNNDKEKILWTLLISNNTFNENGGVILGLDEDSVVLSYTFIANTFSYLRFKNTLKNFVDIAEKNIIKFKEF